MLHFPSYHTTRSSRKVQGWNITVHEGVLILGDTNLHRIPGFTLTDLQIDSYPDANFYHFTQLLAKTPQHPEVWLVVLSLGLNNREQDPNKTSIKQLRTVVKLAASVFPSAELFIPLIHYSRLLPQVEQRNLSVINKHIQSKYQPLPLLPADQFTTEDDNLSWKTEMARLIFELWVKQLSLIDLADVE